MSEQPGAALDAEIHQRVFQQEIKCAHGENCSDIPPYSTDDAAAMAVFERAVEMVGCGSISADMEDARGEGFVVSVSFGFDGARATGPLALAVCRAALLSLEPIGEESL